LVLFSSEKELLAVLKAAKQGAFFTAGAPAW
jgi:hypothetical protein